MLMMNPLSFPPSSADTRGKTSGGGPKKQDESPYDMGLSQLETPGEQRQSCVT